jgi:dTDP-4-dehydrorhamnose reductase
MKEAMDKLKPSAIIFCASASSKGGNAFAVDDQGVGNAAQVAKDANARFILVSALAVDRPNSKSFQMTNTLGGNFDGIMDAKFKGEERVRKTLKDYVIVRPGVLMSGKTTRLGATGVELNQGDYLGGGLSRDELAEVVVAALDSNIRGVTVEVYRRATRTKLQPEFPDTSGKEHSGAATYSELFTTGGPLKLD